jgi:hypothetical protein
MARQTGVSGRVADGKDAAVTTRPSSSANFYVNSLDKVRGQSSGDFLINKNQSLFNGFFKRIASAEVVMDWGLPNVAEWWGNNQITVVNNVTAAVITAIIPDGFYTAIQALQVAADALDAAAIVAGDPLRLSVTYDGIDVRLVSDGVGADPFYIFWIDGIDPPYALARQLFTTAQLAGASVANTSFVMASPRVLGTTYVDIVSPQLTYNQDLKDSTTSDVNNRDVLYRWYFANDNVPQYLEKFPRTLAAVPPAPAVTVLQDTQIPIIQGYTSFVQRRALPYPKQILWNSEQPIGQVAFQVYDDRGRLINTANFPVTLGEGGANFQFQLSMLLSEN